MYTNVATSQASRDVFSTEVHIAWSPDATYARLRTARAAGSSWRLLARAFVVLVVIGTIVPTMASGRATAGLLAWSSAVWSFAVLIQMAVAAALITSAPRRSIPMFEALDLWFAGHLPYSLWLLCGAIIIALSGPAAADPLPAVLLSAVVPAAWTSVIVAAFCRRVLDLPAAAAKRRAAAHLLVTWTIVFSYMAWASGGWFQIADATLRLFRR
jgi:hypothetical protein